MQQRGRRRASKARERRILFCIRLTSNAAGVDAAPAECIVYFDRCPQRHLPLERRTDQPAARRLIFLHMPHILEPV